jgi:sialidase-1
MSVGVGSLIFWNEMVQQRSGEICMCFQRVFPALAAAAVGLFSASCDAALFEETVAVKIPRGVYGPRGMMGDFVVLKDGTLLMAYTQDGSIVAIKSPDQGKTWGQPLQLVATPQPPAKGMFCHPSLLRLPGGDLLLSYIYVYPAAPYYEHNYYRRSADDGKTWSEQFVMTPFPGVVEVHNDRLQLLSTGRILAAAARKAYDPSTNDHGGYVGMAFFSDDQGYSWQASKNTVDMHKEGVEVQECDAVELKDGRVMLFARSYSGHPVRAYSSDGGATWSKGEMIRNIIQPYAGFASVRRIPATGDLLFIWCGEKSDVAGASPRRSALTCAISRDEGKTFLHQRNIARDPDDDFGYQCIEFVGKDMVIIGYHAREGIRVARIGVDWFYGK